MMNKLLLKKYFLLFSICIAVLVSFSQTAHIGGFINKYAAVTAINFCDNKVVVDDPSSFHVGQKVMIMQMKGATIDASNTSAFGNVTNYNGCGNYEVQTIKTITGSTIEFTYAIVRDYDAAGAVQIISVEEYAVASVDSVLRGVSWNGSKGGVIILKADTIILNDSIRAWGIGFRGAARINDSLAQACYNNGFGGATDYYCSNLYCGAPKGEGIGSTSYGFGRGKNGNGGGGGDDHNTGGGGGGNYGSGGVGGIRSNVANNACPGPAAGVGGVGLNYSNAVNKIFMGGGGGAGDENNNEGTGGVNGAGIVILMANTLITNNNKRINVQGNGQTVLARSDGAGGGGAAGTVLLYVDNFIGNLQIAAEGGRGGNLDNGGSQTFCMGPGGGGSGGVLWVKTNTIPGNVSLLATGGINGKDTYVLGPAACPFGTTNGALPGSDGGSLTGLNIVTADVPYVKLAATSCCDTTVCPNQPIRMTEQDTSTYPATVLWSNGSSQHSFTENVSATTVYTVTVSDHRNCQIIQSHTATVYNNIVGMVTCCDTVVCSGGTVGLNVSAPSVPPLTYLWSTGATTTSITPTVFTSQTFYVTATDPNGCSIEQSADVTVGNTFPNFNVCCDTVLCAASPLTFVASTTASPVSYIWSSGQNTASITQQVSSTQTFTVTVSNTSGCSATASVNALVNNVPPVFSVCCDTTFCPGGTLLAAASSDSLLNYNWSSGQNTASITQQVFSAQTFIVIATAPNGCTASQSVNVNVNNTPPPFSVCCDTTFCSGGTLLANASSDSVLTYAWSSGQNTSAITQQVFITETITVTGTDANGCTATQSVSATINNIAPAFTLCCDTSFCISGTVLANVSSVNPLSYNWSNGQTTASISQTISSAQSIYVTVTDANGCTAEDFIDVLIQNTPPAFSVCCDTVICPSGNASFAVISSGSSQFNYNWSSGEQTVSITQQISAAQTFTVTVSDQNGCTGTGSASATINNSAVDFSVCCDTVVCDGNAAVFTASSVSAMNYVWSSGETTAAVSEVITAPQTFTVTATNAAGCSGTRAVQADISIPQTVVTAVPDTNISLGQTVQLSASGDSGTTYSWSPATGLDNAGIQNPKAAPDSTTTYCVTATDRYGCTATACYKIEILLPDIKIPDAFSPNGDGVNDEFIIFPLSSTIEDIKIYNRWGEVVFSAKGNAAWNGSYKGSVQQAGNFVLQVSYTNPLSPGKTNTIVKDIILVR